MTKFLTPEEVKKLTLAKDVINPNTKIYQDVSDLEVGQSLLIYKKEWAGKAPPITRIPTLTFFKRPGYAKSDRGKTMYGKKFSFRTLADKSGWVCTRIA